MNEFYHSVAIASFNHKKNKIIENEIHLDGIQLHYCIGGIVAIHF